MIDTTTERLIPFSEAAKLLPSRHAGRRVAVSTIWRWHHPGVSGVNLETVCVGGSRFTSAEALDRFFQAVTAARQSGGKQAQSPVRSRSKAQQQRSSQAAVKRLAKKGV
jgi:hypothetical protein